MKKSLHMLAILMLAIAYQTPGAYSLAINTNSSASAFFSSGDKGRGNYCDDDSDEDSKKDHDHNKDGKGDGCDDKDHKNDDPKHEPGKNCSTSQPRPISGNQHPCPGDIEYYTIENDRNYTSFVWDVPRAHAGNAPEGWVILEGQGTNRVKVRVGEKSGTMKVKVTDPICGTKVATLPIKPGKDFEVTITGPDSTCVNEIQQYRASVNRNGNGKGKGHKKGEFIYTWTVPAGWEIIEGQGTAAIRVKPGTTDGDVSLTVKDNAGVSGNGNNGNGVGGYKQGYCGTASDRIRVVTNDNCSTPPACPTPTVSIAGPDTVCAYQDAPVTYLAETSGTTEMTTFVWTVPADWDIVAGQGTSSIEVMVGAEAGQVTVNVANSCGTKASNTLGVFADENCGVIAPLPVELISFEGEATKSGVLLEWATATEKNNDRFEVERSTNGVTFTKIAEVKGNGNATAKRTYSLRDAKASRGTHYYRLKQVDFDGTSEYSKMIAVENNLSAAASGLLVAPNPANGQFTIALDNSEA
ncbi:MAG: hypothetical protein ACO1NZ_17630, partial [Adhaeribacter sp.]